MHAVQLTYRRLLALRWRGLMLIAASGASFAMLLAFGPTLNLPLPVRVLLSALAGLGIAVGRLLRSGRQ